MVFSIQDAVITSLLNYICNRSDSTTDTNIRFKAKRTIYTIQTKPGGTITLKFYYTICKEFLTISEKRKKTLTNSLIDLRIISFCRHLPLTAASFSFSAYRRRWRCSRHASHPIVSWLGHRRW
jgi:hypothetical protein